ncbi:MAG: LysM peptidoglycan-binding domain-containing protein [Anaerolineae bacterium]
MRYARGWFVLLMGVMALSLLVPTRADAAPASSTWCSQWYTVQPGDNLFRIALRYGTTVSALQSLNGIANPHYIQWGRTICVRGGAPAPHGFWYTVRWGDTLYSIARRYGVSVWSLTYYNYLPYPNRIYAGQALWIP